MQHQPDPYVDFKSNQRAMWASFTPTAMFTTPVAGQLVRFADITPGERLLDVGTGTGVVAVTAARAGARVSALDLTPQLVEQARLNSSTAVWTWTGIWAMRKTCRFPTPRSMW